MASRLYDYRRHADLVADLLPYAAEVGINPSVWRHKDGTLQYALAYRGQDLDAATLVELRANAARMNNVLLRVGDGWGLFFHMRRQRVHTYPDTVSTHPVIQAVDAERRTYFLEQPHFHTQYVCSLVWKPPTVLQQTAERLLWEHDDPDHDTHAEDIATFQDQCRRFTDMFADCVAWAQPLDGDALATELHAPLSDNPHPVRLPDIPMYLDCLVSDRDLLPGVRPYLGDQHEGLHIRALTLRGFPNESYPGVLHALDELPQEFSYTVRWLPLDKLEAYKIMKTRAGLWWQAKDAIRTAILKNAMGNEVQAREDREALSKTEELEAAMDECAGGSVVYGYFTGTFVVRHADPKVADEMLRQIERTITGQGFTVHRETLNAVEAWLGHLLGHCQANVRRPMLHTRNVVDLAPTTAVWTGNTDSTPLLLAETRGATPFPVVLQERGVGHTLLVGAAGTGKTTALGLMALQFQARFPQAKVRLFDKKYGLEPVTKAVGGDHYILSGDASTGTGLQPLRDIHQVDIRQWASALIEGLVTDQHVALTPELRGEIWQALESLSTMSVEHRTMTGNMYLLQHEILRQAVAPYTTSGAYGHCVDQVAPPLRLSDWSCFETDGLFQVAPLIAPTLAVVFHELGLSFAERHPTLLGLDEAHKYLSHPVFLTKIEEWLRELRKLNVSVIFSTQDLMELLESPIATVILNNCPIRILLPNERAQESRTAKAYREIGLNERQLELLALATPHRDYMFMSKQGTRMMELAIGPRTLEILTGRNTA